MRARSRYAAPGEVVESPAQAREIDAVGRFHVIRQRLRVCGKTLDFGVTSSTPDARDRFVADGDDEIGS